MSVGRNDPCPCGSGKKHKHCCLKSGGPDATRRNRGVQIAAAVVIVLAIAAYFTVSQEVAALIGFGGLGAIGLWLWFVAPPPGGGGADPSAINFGR